MLDGGLFFQRYLGESLVHLGLSNGSLPFLIGEYATNNIRFRIHNFGYQFLHHDNFNQSSYENYLYL